MQALDVTLETEQTSRLARESGQLVVRVARGEPRLSASIGSAKPAQTTPLLEAAASLRRRRLCRRSRLVCTGSVGVMPSRIELDREGTRLACWDFGGSGPPVLLLHGLAGHSGEWNATAESLASAFRVLALDQRGHGDSETTPGDVSREAFVVDVAAVIDQLGLGPVVLVGHSMGANTAMLMAAEHPALVRALVVAEGSPDGPQQYDPQPDVAALIRQWLARWPVPFPDADVARAFFRHQGLEPTAWTAGLRPRADGLWPAFEPTVMVDCIADLASRNYWRQWRAIQCPALIVFGQHGYFTAEHGTELAAQLPDAALLTIPDAGHDVHLDAPGPWAHALQAFLARVDDSG